MSKKASKDQRELKVYTKYAFSMYGKPSTIPEIRLKGDWVRNWGFKCGDSVRINKIGNNILILNRNNSLPIIKL